MKLDQLPSRVLNYVHSIYFREHENGKEVTILYRNDRPKSWSPLLAAEFLQFNDSQRVNQLSQKEWRRALVLPNYGRCVYFWQDWTLEHMDPALLGGFLKSDQRQAAVRHLLEMLNEPPYDFASVELRLGKNPNDLADTWLETIVSIPAGSWKYEWLAELYRSLSRNYGFRETRFLSIFTRADISNEFI